MSGLIDSSNDISTDDIINALSQGRMLMADSQLNPEDSDSGVDSRTEWNRGNVAPTIYCGATTGTQSQRMHRLFQFFSK